MSAIDAVESEEQQHNEQPGKVPEGAEVIDLTALSDGPSDEDETESDGDSSDGEELVVDANSREELRVALRTVPAARLQEIIMALVMQIPAVERAMTKEFVGPKAGALKRQREEEDVDGDGEQTERCVRCHEEYVAADEGECAIHPGQLKVNYEAFVDWDEEVHGPMESEETKREYPENYTWTCCKEDGVSTGCVKTKHEPAPGHNKRRRTDSE
ncbi:hypothetical protein AAF712_009643 [Marasmius tenuissimus]|uniref:Uncharacterized protein n=1 Tax=Marasmius tenuissimus TaxID=585030 RepID=A0ABR2ZQJ2_9AGAR|nr:hypothetical protein PM082_015574 [Marasmius tenuissimus]